VSCKILSNRPTQCKSTSDKYFKYKYKNFFDNVFDVQNLSLHFNGHFQVNLELKTMEVEL